MSHERIQPCGRRTFLEPGGQVAWMFTFKPLTKRRKTLDSEQLGAVTSALMLGKKCSVSRLGLLSQHEAYLG